MTSNLYAQNQDNALSTKEKSSGWALLFNGKDLAGWTTAKGETPDTDWKVEEGILSLKPDNKQHLDLITVEEFSDFDLQVDFKLTEGANSGIKYFFTSYDVGGWLGPEYQIIDNNKHPDAKLGLNGNRQLGTLYDILPLTKKVEIKVGEWNRARIVAKGTSVKHYVNGKEVLSYDRNSPAFDQARKSSKFKDTQPAFGTIQKGHILLQDHGDLVFFKNIKIKTL